VTISQLAPERDDLPARLDALRATMAARGVAAAVLTSPENVYYLTGLDHLGYFAVTLLLVPLAGPPVLVTRAMERHTVAAQVPWCRHVVFGEGDDPASAAAAVLGELAGAGRAVGAELASMYCPPAVHAGLRAALAGRDWVDVTGWLSEQRAVKSAAEIARVRRAAAVTDAAMCGVLATVRPGASERAVAAEAYRAMILAGGRPPGFAPLIRPVAMLAQEHVSWADRTLAAGGRLFVELSGCVDRYHAPASRTLYLPPVPDAAREAAAAADAGLAAARAALRPGVRTGDVYAAWQRAVAASTAGAWPRRHHCGYLVGIGFPPSWVGGGEVLGIRPGGDTVVRAGMTFHLMSWLDAPVGHVVSDTALVTADGSELLTTTPRGLIELS
jgi:Xaa-Pro aminopeptidase